MVTGFPLGKIQQQRLTMIETELDRLDASYLHPLAHMIVHAFLDFPFDPEHEPSHQFLTKLKTLKKPVNPRQLHRLLANLDAFTYRAFVQLSESPVPTYWNPLEMRYNDFFPNHRKTILHTEHSYPPADIILHACDNLLPGQP